MKKIKLFALAVMAMLSTNAFAAGEKYATGVYRYEVLTDPAGEVPGTAKILGYVAEYTGSVATTAIPATVTNPTDNKIKYNVTEIAADAFNGNADITAFDFTEATNLTTIPAAAFIGTKITALDLSTTKVSAINRLFTDATHTTYATLLSVSLPATVASIAESAFDGCSKLNSVTFAALDAEAAKPNVTTIGVSAFKKTDLTALDLTNTKITALNPLYETVNNKLTEIKLPATLTSIEANAFEGLSVLTSLDFSACKNAIEIKGNAFKNTMALTTLELPELAITLTANTFAGSYLTAVTFNGDVNTVDDAFSGAESLTTLTFNGKVAGAAGAFENAKLKTINFKADLALGSIVSGTFVKAATTQMITVNYSPSYAKAGDVVQAFDAEAFGVAKDAYWATINTTAVYGAKCEELGWNTKGTAYGVKLAYTAVTPDPTTIPVYSKGGASASYYYGTWISASKDIKIAKKQGEKSDVNVMVYGAYVDNAASGTAILMDQLLLIDGYYYIPQNTPVIVKSSSNAAVVYTEDATKNSVKYKSDMLSLVSEIEINNTGDEVFAKTIKDLNTKMVPYFLAPIEEYGFLWSKFKDNTVVAANGFYVWAKPTAAAAPSLNVVWLDGSEEDQTTAIETVKNVVEDDAIYNLAGQKVSASYKGVVIKNGKKMIQK